MAELHPPTHVQAEGDFELTRLLLLLGKALHRVGVPAHRLEGAMSSLANAIGVQASFFSTPTLLLATFGELGRQRTQVIRVDQEEIHLTRLVAIDRLATRVGNRKLTPQAAVTELEDIESAPDPWPAWIVTLACCSASGCAALLFGGDWATAALASLGALLVRLIAIVAGTIPARRRMRTALSSFVVALVCHRVAAHVPVNIAIAILAGLLALLPGLTLTVAVTEIATRNLSSGSARLLDGVATLTQLGFGALLGTTLGAWLGPTLHHTDLALPTWQLWICALVTSCSLIFQFQATAKHGLLITSAGLISWGALQWASLWLGADVGLFAAAAIIGATGNAVARIRRLPATVFVVPGLILLVPGSAGFSSVQQLLSEDVVAGMSAAVRVLLLSSSLAAGLLMAQALVPPRRSL
ncbi:MAG TPA: hypothetical protein DCQ06_08545 [Myxococcales bacterium]|nr:hypothetical protein [Myxococcales bacterium]HAN31629.1 hypothetical protein [Myxococcales bacterium]